MAGNVRTTGVDGQGRAGSLEELLRRAAAAARQDLQATTIAVLAWERSSGSTQALVVDGDAGFAGARVPAPARHMVADWPLVERLLREGRAFTLSVDDPGGDPAMQAWLRQIGHGSCVGAPIMLNGQVWGELMATRSAQLPPFQEADVQLGADAATRLAAAIAPVQHVEALSRLAYSDTLTDLANRRAVEERLAGAIGRHGSEGTVVSLVVVDVTGLARINQEHGRAAGDRVLVDVAGLLSSMAGLAPGSLVGRLGGERFCIVLEGYPADEAVEVAQSLYLRPGGSLDAGLACGVASTGDPVGVVTSGARLLSLADTAMATARRLGTDRPVVAGRQVPAIEVPAVDAPAQGSAATSRRRSRAGRSPQRVLQTVLATLDEPGPGGPGRRLEVVAKSVCGLVDGCGWWVSRTDDSWQNVLTVSWSAVRFAAGPVEPQLDDESTYPLADYPMTVRMLRGDSAVVRADDPDADPSERGILSASGYTAMAMAGGPDAEGHGWLVEIFFDPLSADPGQLPPVLRSLTACALLG